MTPLEIGLLFVALISIVYGVYITEKYHEAESNSASEFMKSRHRVINPKKKDKDNE